MKIKIKKQILTFLFVSSSSTLNALAQNPIINSKPVQGIQRLLNDASVAILWIAPILIGLLIGYFALMSSFAKEEMEKMKWKKSIINSAISLVVIFSVSGIVALVTTYFK